MIYFEGLFLSRLPVFIIIAIFVAMPFVVAMALAKKEKIAYPDGYQAKVISIYDGDTFTAQIFSWPQHSIEARVRIRGIDTPEIRGKCKSEKEMAQKAKERLIELIPINHIVQLHQVVLGTYAGRIIADVSTEKFQNIGAMMIKEGFARHYHVKEGRKSWC